VRSAGHRYGSPPGAGRQFGRVLHAQPCLPAAVAGLGLEENDAHENDSTLPNDSDLTSGAKPLSLAQENTATRSATMETCPKCGRQEPKLTAVIDSATMSQKLLCTRCARATMRIGSIGVNMDGNVKKWWQFWKR
jgi:hypothetical protein